jgi:DNA-binding response OmpR family regulator
MNTRAMSLCQPAVVQTVQNAVARLEESAAMPARILVIEDERVLAKNLKTYLSRGASEVRTAAGAAQAFEMLESFAPDALVLDFGLPDVDGLRTYAEIIRRQARKLDCVMITGNPTEQLAQDARKLGIHHIVSKPFRFSELQRLLEAPTAATANDAPDASE